MEAPEKIYLEKIYPDNGVLPNGLNYNQSPNDIEYIRTDAFINKVANYLNNILYDRVEINKPGTIIPSLCTKGEFIEDFRNYIKGK